MGQSPSSSACGEKPVGLPFLQGNAEFGDRYPRHLLFCSTPTKLCDKADILLSVRAPVGEINQADQAYVIGRGLAAVRFTKLPAAFGWHALHFSAPALDRVAQGSTFTAVGRHEVESLLVPTFHPDECTRIASVLDTLDAAIGNTDAVIAKLQQMRTGLVHDLLTRGLNEDGHLRDPIVHPEQFKDSPIGRIPREWEIRTLSECVKSQITYGIVQAGPDLEGGVPYIRTGDMIGDELQVEAMLRTSHGIAAAYKRSEVHTEEIVCAIRATLGKVLQVPPALDGANLTQGTARIAPKPELNARYILWALRSSSSQGQIAKQAKGTTFAEITLTDLRKLIIAVPNRRKEQDGIVSAIDAHEQIVRSEHAYHSKLLVLKSALETDLLTGRVRVPDSIASKAA